MKTLLRPCTASPMTWSVLSSRLSTSLLNSLYIVYCRDICHGNTLPQAAADVNHHGARASRRPKTGVSGEFAGQRFFAEFAAKLELKIGLIIRTRYRSANGSTRARVRGSV